MGRLAAFLAVVVGGGLFVVPRLARAVVRLDRPETTVVTSVGLCFGFALLAHAAGYSVALGAFLAGALVAESGEAEVFEHLIQPVRDIFAAVFFISVGMLIDPVLVARHWPAVLLLTAVLISTALWGGELTARVGSRLSLSGQLTGAVVIAAAIAIAVPFSIGIARCTAALARILADLALPSPSSGIDLAEAPRRVLVITLEIAILLLVGAPLVALTTPFLPPLTGPLLLGLVIVILVLALWRSATNLQEHTRAGAQVLVEALARQLGSASGPGEAGDPDFQRLHQLLPGLGAPRPVRLGADSLAVGKTLSQLRLRGLTGATVLAILGGHDGVLVPTGREQLQAGDVLAVAGTASALESAEQLLGRSGPAPGQGTGEPG